MGRPPSIPAEKKTRIVLSVLAGEMSIAEAARKEKVSEQSIGRWKAEFLEAGKTALVAGRSGPSSREEGQVPGSGVTVFEVVGGLYLSGLQGRHHLRAHHGLLLRGQGLTAPGEQFQAEIPAAFGPFICLLGQHGPDQAHHGIPVREDPHRVRAAPDLPVQPLGGVVRPDLAPHVPRERGEREDVLSSGV